MGGWVGCPGYVSARDGREGEGWEDLVGGWVGAWVAPVTSVRRAEGVAGVEGRLRGAESVRLTPHQLPRLEAVSRLHQSKLGRVSPQGKQQIKQGVLSERERGQ